MKIFRKMILFSIILTFMQYYLTGQRGILPQFFNNLDDAFLIFIILIILFNKVYRKKFNIRKDYMLFFYLLCVSFVIGGIKLIPFLMSLNDIFHFFIYFIIFKEFFKDREFELINVIGYFSVINTVLALYQFLTFIPGADLTQRLRWDSAVGFFGGGAANNFSIFNGILFFIILAYKDIDIKKKIIFLMSNIVGLMLGCSKMGILVFFVVLIIMIIRTGKKNKKIIIIGSIFFVILAYGMGKYFSEEFNAIKSVGDVVKGQVTSTSSGRLSWVINYDHNIKSILFGNGPGQISSFAALRTNSQKLWEICTDGVFGSRTECDLITIFIEYGILPLIILVYFLLRSSNSKIISSGILYCIIVSISSRIFQAQYTSVLIGLLMYLKYCDKNKFMI